MGNVTNIYSDSKIVDVLVAQANNESIDSKTVEDTEAVYAELYNNPTPHNRYLMANLVTYAVQRRLAAETDWRRYVADEKQIGDTDEAAFQVRNDGIKAFILAKGSTTPRSFVSHRRVILPTTTVSCRPAVHLLEMRSGKIKMADLVADATREMANIENRYIENVLLTAAVKWGEPFYGTGAGVVPASLDPMIQHWMRTGSCALVGDIAVVQKLAKQAGFTSTTSTMQFSPDTINEYNKTGRIGLYAGASVVQFVNPYETDGKTTVMKQNALFVIPTATSVENRPLKVVRKGNILTTDNTNIDDLTYEIRMDEQFGAGIAMGAYPEMSVYIDSSIK